MFTDGNVAQPPPAVQFTGEGACATYQRYFPRTIEELTPPKPKALLKALSIFAERPCSGVQFRSHAGSFSVRWMVGGMCCFSIASAQSTASMAEVAPSE